MAKKIKCRALAFQNRSRGTVNTGDDSAKLDGMPIRHFDIERHGGIKQPKCQPREIETGNNARLTRDQSARPFQMRCDHGGCVIIFR